MPLVFVHGVAHRNTPEGLADDAQRKALFKRLVLPAGAEVHDPDWGSNAVSFDPEMPWLPKGNEAFGAGAAAMGGVSAPVGGVAPGGPVQDDKLGEVASDDPHAAIDLAFEAALAARSAEATGSKPPSDAIDEGMIEAFAATVAYLESGAFDPDAFAQADSVRSLVDTLSSELKLGEEDEIRGIPMSAVGDAFQWVRQGLGNLAGAARNAAAAPLLRVGRAPLSRGLAYFLGDVFVYLQERGTEGWQNPIFAPIIADLIKAAKQRTGGDPLIVVGHSLGGVILYDLLSDQEAVAAIEAGAESPLQIDALVTVGSQPSFFADLGLYKGRARNADSKRFPMPEAVRAWINVYDATDVLSFACKPLFEGVDDYQYDNVTGLLDAHTAYFRRPSFYVRLRERLAALP